MDETGKRKGKRYVTAAACGLLALAVIAAAYQMGRGAGPAGRGDVGQETAKSVALSHAEVPENNLSHYEIAREERGGAAVYEVKFTADSVAYAYEINAADGSIAKFSRTSDGGISSPAEQGGEAASGNADIGETQAWEIAYSHAGVTAAETSASPAKLDYDGGVQVYELEFFSGGYEYDYEISAADGSVVKFEKEPDVRSAPPQTPGGNSGGTPAVPASGTPSASGDIGEARAKEIALAHAGVTADSVSGYKWKLDHEGGVQVYELEFLAGGYEYDYEVNAADGSIVKFEKEQKGGAAVPQTNPSSPGELIGEARAKEIAFTHAGISASDASRCKTELDSGRKYGGANSVYEVEFRCAGYEYEYKIDAVTGEILEYKQERDD